MFEQQQFLDVIDRDEAERRFHRALDLHPLGEEPVALAEALGRVLARDVHSTVDVPSFDRSNFDGFAVQAADTFGASEEVPRRLALRPEAITTAVEPTLPVAPGTCVPIATGAMLPRGADAVVMVEHTDVDGQAVMVRRAVSPGQGVTFAGTDVTVGEIVLRAGDLLTSRETGVLAAIGAGQVRVWRRPSVGILSTGDELIEPGQAMSPGLVYDSNARILADAVRELGAVPRMFGIVPDDADQLQSRLGAALQDCDVVLLSGGTSKGGGDFSYQVVGRLRNPGIVAHGVALKPGKPICLAVTQGKPVVILPGFPTSAIFTFHEFVAPVIRLLGGRPKEARARVRARLPVKVISEIGRTEYLLVGLTRGSHTVAGPTAGCAPVSGEVPLTAYPMGQGSGSVTTFSRADGFTTIGRYEELVPAGTLVDVELLGRELRVADLVVMGSHCVGLDYLLGQLQALGIQTKFLAVGSTAGLDAVRRGECDIAGVHLWDPASGRYNEPFLDENLLCIRGYGRQQGLVFRKGDPRFVSRNVELSLARVISEPSCVMVNRNQGSGTRLLIDQLLQGAQPAGYSVQPRNHRAVAAAIRQGRADWGVAVRIVAEQDDLDFLPLTMEQFDFVVLRARHESPAIQAFRTLLSTAYVRTELNRLGFAV